MVPDVLSFPDSVAGIDLEAGGYTVEVTDEDNTLLGGDESDDEEDVEPNDEEDLPLFDPPGLRLTPEQEALIARYLRNQFPCLGTDEKVSGAVVVRQLADVYSTLTEVRS